MPKYIAILEPYEYGFLALWASAGMGGTDHTPLTVTINKALGPQITIFLRVRELKISNWT